MNRTKNALAVVVEKIAAGLKQSAWRPLAAAAALALATGCESPVANLPAAATETPATGEAAPGGTTPGGTTTGSVVVTFGTAAPPRPPRGPWPRRTAASSRSSKTWITSR